MDENESNFNKKVIIEDEMGSFSSFEFSEDEIDLYSYGIKMIEL